MKTLMADVSSFYKKVLKLSLLKKFPCRLSSERKQFAVNALCEEVQEYKEAKTLSAEIDALLDLLYFLVGRLLEHGVTFFTFSSLWRQVHNVNMQKKQKATQRGAVDAKRAPGAPHTDFKWLDREPQIALFLKAVELCEQKQKDYGPFHEYFPFGEVSAVQMLYIKVQRLVFLAKKENSTVTFESKKDTIIDLINYASAYYELLSKG